MLADVIEMDANVDGLSVALHRAIEHHVGTQPLDRLGVPATQGLALRRARPSVSGCPTAG